jgi:hypothetical protein
MSTLRPGYSDSRRPRAGAERKRGWRCTRNPVFVRVQVGQLDEDGRINEIRPQSAEPICVIDDSFDPG